MPAILAYVLGASVLSGIVRFCLSAASVGIVTFVGFDLLLDQLNQFVASGVGGIPADVLGLAGLSGVDTAINLVLSGCSIRVSLIAVNQFRPT